MQNGGTSKSIVLDKIRNKKENLYDECKWDRKYMKRDCKNL